MAKPGPKGDREHTATLKALFVEQFRAKLGNVYQAATAVGINRRTYTQWKSDDEQFAAEIAEALEDVKDQIESLILTGKSTQTGRLAWLNARAKDRGYGLNRHEHTGAGGGPITFEVVDFAPETSPNPRQV